MSLLKVGDYLPEYLTNKLEFSAPGFKSWAKFLLIFNNRSYLVTDVKEAMGLYFVSAAPIGGFDTFIIRIKDVDSVIAQHQSRKPRFKNFIAKIFNFK